jgi:hypothetical protein
MTREVRQFTVHEDARGGLLPIMLEDVGFPVVRLFTVTAPPGGADRGDHEVPCRQLLVLIAGTAVVRLRSASGGPEETLVLDRPGAGVELHPGEHVRYRLADEQSWVLVLADAPYVPEMP